MHCHVARFDYHGGVICPLLSCQVEPLVKSYLGNTLHLLGSMAQPTMTAYVLRRLRASVAFLGPFPRLTKRTLRLALSTFGGSGDDEAPRLQVRCNLRDRHHDRARRDCLGARKGDQSRTGKYGRRERGKGAQGQCRRAQGAVNCA